MPANKETPPDNQRPNCRECVDRAMCIKNKVCWKAHLPAKATK